MPILVDILFDNQQLERAGYAIHTPDHILYDALSCGADDARKYYEISRNQIGVTFKVKAPYEHGQSIDLS